MTVLPEATTDVPRTHRRYAPLFAGALLAALMVGLYADVVFSGRSLIHSNHFNPYDFRPIPDNYGPALVPHTEWADRNLWIFPNLRDPGATWWQWEPSTEFFKQAIARREWPFWDPYVGGGTPAMTNLVPAFFFPPYTLLVLLGAGVALKNAYFLILLWAASQATFLFLARHQLSFVASLCGAVIVMVSGAMTQNLGAFACQTLACLPFALYATRVFLDRPSPARAAAVAITYAGVSLASFPPLLLGVFGVTAVYATVALVSGDCGEGAVSRQHAWALWLGAVLLSGGLVAAYYLPAVALSRATPHVSQFYRGAGLEALPLRNIYQLLSPTIMGGVQVYLKAPFASAGWGGHIPYGGIGALMLALLAATHTRKQRTLLVATSISALIIGLKIFGVPPVQWIGHLPFFDQIHFSHYLGGPFEMLFVFLGALGAEQLGRGPSVRRAVIATAISLLALVSVWWIAARNGGLMVEGASDWIRDWKVLAAATIAMSVVALGGAWARNAQKVRFALVLAAIAVIAAENAYNNRFPRPAAWDAFEHPVPYVRVLRKEAAMQRVFVFGVPAANTNEAFRVFGVDSLMPFNPTRMFELYQRYSGASREVFMRAAGRIPPDPVLDRANVSFIATYNSLLNVVGDATTRGYEKRFDNGFATIFRRPSLPRFFFSSEYRIMPASTALDAIAVAPAREILLEEDPGRPSSPNAAGDPAVEVVDYNLNSQKLTVDAPRPGLVYASENYCEGWTVTVNGVSAKLLPANYAFRAVAVPAGRSEIEFRYRPPGLTSGLAISIASLLALGVLASRDRPVRSVRL